MDIQTLTSFLMWCTVINGGILFFSFLLFVVAGDWAHQLHSRWFPMSRETHALVMYSWMGGFKILWIVFNVVPYVALLIVG